ncbi:MAG: putative glycoside hydrolase [Clostridiales bacterium]|nr:putative glycoside hydrolase [Clostridiales bacterium]
MLLSITLLAGCGHLYFNVIDGSSESLTDVIDPSQRMVSSRSEPAFVAAVTPASGQEAEDIPPEPTGINYDRDVLESPLISFAAYKKPVEARGLYLSSNAAGVSNTFINRLDFIEQKGMNAIVIDVKDDLGNMTFKGKLQSADESGISVANIPDIDALMAELKARDIYTIARIVSFRDQAVANVHPEFILKLTDGTELWTEESGNTFCWLNPYNKDVWTYILDIAVEAAKVGFDEIQFDYVRFSTSQRVKIADFGFDPESNGNPSFIETICDFGRYAMERLKPYGVKVSADVFATVIISDLDASLIGQDFTQLAGIFDIVSPMVYPSHYGNGTFGIANPDLNPYETLNETFKIMNQKLENSDAPKKAVIRPWLQDFTASWLGSGKYRNYGGDEINAQIKACADNGMTEWLLWDSANRYNGAASGL